MFGHPYKKCNFETKAGGNKKPHGFQRWQNPIKVISAMDTEPDTHRMFCATIPGYRMGRTLSAHAEMEPLLE